MQPAPDGSYIEAVDQWKLSVRRMASPLPGYEESTFRGASAIWGNVLFPLTNHAFLEQPVRDTDELNTVTDGVCGFAASRDLPWMFTMCEPWLPAGAADVLQAHGLAPAIHFTYMTATELAPSLRAVPPLEYRLVDSEELAAVASDMNATAYDMPVEMSRSALAGGAMWLKDAYGYVAYVNGVAVSTATTLNAGDCLNAVCVATPAEHQRKGYAEAVLRHSLNQARRATGIERMVLHATDAGYPIYKRMGFEPVVSMMIWAPAHSEA